MGWDDGLWDSGTWDDDTASPGSAVEAPRGAWSFALDAYDIDTGLLAQVGPGAPIFTRGQLVTNDDKRPLRHGMIATRPDLLTTLDIEIPFTILAGSGPEAETELDKLQAAWAPAEDGAPVWLGVGDPTGRKSAFYGKPRNVGGISEALVRSGIITGMALFEATDPLRFSAVESTAGLDVVSATGGFGFPYAFPFGFTSSGNTIVALPNGGNATTWPILTLTANGSLGEIVLTDQNTGAVWGFDGTIPDTCTLIVDMQEGTVLQTGAGGDMTNLVSRSTSVRRPSSEWLAIPSGGTNWKIQATIGQGRATATWRDAWYR